jgi:hypothetical protein
MMLDLIVMRVAGNRLMPTGGPYVVRALMQLTGLQTLFLEPFGPSVPHGCSYVTGLL